MILLLGGTTETDPVATALAEQGYPVLVSMVTAVPLLKGEHPLIQKRIGPLEQEAMISLIRAQSIKVIVDVTHPYAQDISHLADRVAEALGLPCFRYQRPEVIPQDQGIFRAADHEKAASLAVLKGDPVLLTTGSKNLGPYVRETARKGLRLIVRVLPDPGSLEACCQAGIPMESIVTGRGPFSVQENRELIRKYAIGVLVTKDSGSSGGALEKIEAARSEGCQVVVVDRPAFQCKNSFNDIHELLEAISNHRIEPGKGNKAMNLFEQTLNAIVPVDLSLEPAIRTHLDQLTKPPKSLGRLEDLAAQYCLITNTTAPTLGKKKIFTFAGDHGVAAEGVSAYPKEVTPQMVRNMLAGGAAVCVLANHVDADVSVIDIGVDDPLIDAPNLIQRKIKSGTDNLAKGPAMSLQEARQAIEVGIELAQSAAKAGITLIGTGEMGIANTTPSSALFAALLPCPVEDITGRGTGIDEAGLVNKIEVIKRALKVNQARLTDPLNTLAALGGMEIAGICGLCLGAAAHRIPVVVDGFISSAGALVACKLSPAVKDYLYFSHRSEEAGHTTFLRIFKVEPILDLKMRLGEGTGAALAMALIEGAVKIYNQMATFASAGVSDKE